MITLKGIDYRSGVVRISSRIIACSSPAVIIYVEHTEKFPSGFPIACSCGMTVPSTLGIGVDILIHSLDVLDRAVPPAVVISSSLVGIIRIAISSITGKNITEIKDCHITICIIFQALVD
jgi:hypothetical protein